MSCAIRVEGLQKSYAGRAVLKGLTFTVEQGEIFALLGVNGAGKTTALECIEGLRGRMAAVLWCGARPGYSFSPPLCRRTSGPWRPWRCLQNGTERSRMRPCWTHWASVG